MFNKPKAHKIDNVNNATQIDFPLLIVLSFFPNVEKVENEEEKQASNSELN